MLRSDLGFPLSKLSKPGASGIGYHKQFVASTWCGEGPFFDGGTFGPDFEEILKRALERSPVGTWEVHVGNWTWIYTFKAGADFTSGSVEWRSFDGSKHGLGTWNKIANLRITWSHGTVEEWNTPLNSSGQSGALVKQVTDGIDITNRLTEQEKAISAHRTD